MLEFSKLFPRDKLQNGGAARASHAFPASMTTFRPWVSKVLEKHVFTDNHCNKVISERVIPLTRIVNHKVLPALNNEYEVGSIYLDFSKDFDKVPHQLLLHKLQKYGIRGPLRHWFTSYPSGVTLEGQYRDFARLVTVGGHHTKMVDFEYFRVLSVFS